jgi:DNA-binding response OmpR family regulator
MHLTDMNGLSLAKSLRADKACAKIGFILTSSEGDSADVTAFLRIPGTVLLVKPFDLKKLAQAVAKATGRAPQEMLPPEAS